MMMLDPMALDDLAHQLIAERRAQAARDAQAAAAKERGTTVAAPARRIPPTHRERWIPLWNSR